MVPRRLKDESKLVRLLECSLRNMQSNRLISPITRYNILTANGATDTTWQPIPVNGEITNIKSQDFQSDLNQRTNLSLRSAAQTSQFREVSRADGQPSIITGQGVTRVLDLLRQPQRFSRDDSPQNSSVAGSSENALRSLINARDDLDRYKSNWKPTHNKQPLDNEQDEIQAPPVNNMVTDKSHQRHKNNQRGIPSSIETTFFGRQTDNQRTKQLIHSSQGGVFEETQDKLIQPIMVKMPQTGVKSIEKLRTLKPRSNAFYQDNESNFQYLSQTTIMAGRQNSSNNIINLKQQGSSQNKKFQAPALLTPTSRQLINSKQNRLQQSSAASQVLQNPSDVIGNAPNTDSLSLLQVKRKRGRPRKNDQSVSNTTNSIQRQHSFVIPDVLGMSGAWQPTINAPSATISESHTENLNLDTNKIQQHQTDNEQLLIKQLPYNQSRPIKIKPHVKINQEKSSCSLTSTDKKHIEDHSLSENIIEGVQPMIQKQILNNSQTLIQLQPSGKQNGQSQHQSEQVQSMEEFISPSEPLKSDHLKQTELEIGNLRQEDPEQLINDNQEQIQQIQQTSRVQGMGKNPEGFLRTVIKSPSKRRQSSVSSDGGDGGGYRGQGHSSNEGISSSSLSSLSSQQSIMIKNGVNEQPIRSVAQGPYHQTDQEISKYEEQKQTQQLPDSRQNIPNIGHQSSVLNLQDNNELSQKPPYFNQLGCLENFGGGQFYKSRLSHVSNLDLGPQNLDLDLPQYREKRLNSLSKMSSNKQKYNNNGALLYGHHGFGYQNEMSISHDAPNDNSLGLQSQKALKQSWLDQTVYVQHQMTGGNYGGTLQGNSFGNNNPPPQMLRTQSSSSLFQNLHKSSQIFPNQTGASVISTDKNQGPGNTNMLMGSSLGGDYAPQIQGFPQVSSSSSGRHHGVVPGLVNGGFYPSLISPRPNQNMPLHSVSNGGFDNTIMYGGMQQMGGGGSNTSPYLRPYHQQFHHNPSNENFSGHHTFENNQNKYSVDGGIGYLSSNITHGDFNQGNILGGLISNGIFQSNENETSPRIIHNS